MRREQRLTGDKRFSRLRQETSRFGFVVGKRVGGAVVRNRVKRRLREAVRLTPVESGWDIVLIARRDAPVSPYSALCRATDDLLRRSRVLSKAPDSQEAGADPERETGS